MPFVDVWISEKLPWAETGAPHAFAGTPEMADWEMLMQSYAEGGARP